MFISQCQREHLDAYLKKDSAQIDPSDILGGNEEMKKEDLNEESARMTLRICQTEEEQYLSMQVKAIEYESDKFNEFPFLERLTTPVLTMKDIYVFEKGKESMRNLKVKLAHNQKKEQSFELHPLKKQKQSLEEAFKKQGIKVEAEKKAEKKTESKKTLALKQKEENANKKMELSLTITKPSKSTRRSSSSSKKSSSTAKPTTSKQKKTKAIQKGTKKNLREMKKKASK